MDNYEHFEPGTAFENDNGDTYTVIKNAGQYTLISYHPVLPWPVEPDYLFYSIVTNIYKLDNGKYVWERAYDHYMEYKDIAFSRFNRLENIIYYEHLNDVSKSIRRTPRNHPADSIFFLNTL